MGWSEAVKEAHASVGNIPILDTIQVYHADEPESLYMVRSRSEFTAFLEDGVTEVTFLPVGFRFTLPKKDGEGLPELNIAVDNIEREASDFINRVKTSNKPVLIIYRPYMSNDPSGPCLNPPIRLTLSDVIVNDYEVSGKATFADFRNRKYPSENYTRSRFPGLGD